MGGVVVCFALFLAAMAVCLVMGWSFLWALLLGLALFTLHGRKQGHSLQTMWGMAWSEGRKVLIVLRIFVFIGAITALWRSGGTIVFFIYYGVQAISPKLFVLVAFLLTALIAYALGTSFGVIGTAGIVLMALARSGGVSEAVAAGAILSGAYFGDRCSPASSSAALVAAETGTKLYDNLRNMLRTGALPVVLTVIVYAVLSVRHPITAVDESLLQALRDSAVISLWALLPAAVMLVLPLVKVPVLISIALSVAAAGLVSVFVQGMTVWDMLKTAVVGYYPTTGQLKDILSGGGIVSMAKPAALVFTTGLLAGLLDGIGVLNGAVGLVEKLARRWGRFAASAAVSLGAGMIFCNQSVVIVMGNQLLHRCYTDPNEQAVDMENSGIVLSALIPWNIACSIPLVMLGVDQRAIPYAVLLYMIPLVYGLTKRYVYPHKEKCV